MKKIFLILLFIISFNVSATNWYISENGSDLNNGTSPISPVKTWSHLSNNLWSNGDTVFCMASDTARSEVFTIDASNAAQNITIKNYYDTKAYEWNAGSEVTLFSVVGNNVANGLTIDGIKITNPTRICFLLQDNFDSFTFKNIHTDGVFVMFYVFQSGNSIDGFYIYNNTCLNSERRMLYLANASPSTLENIYVYNNYIDNPQFEGILIENNSGTIRKLYCYNNIVKNAVDGFVLSTGSVSSSSFDYNNFYNISGSDLSGLSASVKYNLDDKSYTSDTLGIDSEPLGLFNDLTPDTLIENGTGVYKQIGLSWQGQIESIIKEDRFNADTWNLVVNDTFYAKMMSKDSLYYDHFFWLNKPQFSIKKANNIIFNSENELDTGNIYTQFANNSFIDTSIIGDTFLQNGGTISTDSFSLNFQGGKSGNKSEIHISSQSDFSDTIFNQIYNNTENGTTAIITSSDLSGVNTYYIRWKTLTTADVASDFNWTESDNFYYSFGGTVIIIERRKLELPIFQKAIINYRRGRR